MRFTPNTSREQRFDLQNQCLLIGMMIGAMCLVSCTGSSSTADENLPALTPVPTVTTTPLAVIQAPTDPNQETDTPAVSSNLVIWWPEPLAPRERPDVTALLNEQIEAFNRFEENEINIEFRLKKAQDIGGVMATLRTASVVAPGAVPDITLLRRDDLISAAEDNLIFPLEGLIPSTILGNLYGTALATGQFEGEIYGLPYMLDVRHLAYYPGDSLQPATTWTFADALTQEIGWAFPGGRLAGIVNNLYPQYLAAGGTPPEDDGSITPDEEAIFAVLSFYENAFQNGLFDETTLTYVTQTDYLPDLMAGTIRAGILDSTTYFQFYDENDGLYAASIPTLDGTPTGTVNGWMWVITATNTEQRVLAAQFMNWMMDVERQSSFAAMMQMLPSRRASMQRIDDALIEAELMEDILTNGIATPSITASTPIARALQNALSAILRGETTAEAATEELMAQLTE